MNNIAGGSSAVPPRVRGPILKRDQINQRPGVCGLLQNGSNITSSLLLLMGTPGTDVTSHSVDLHERANNLCAYLAERRQYFKLN